MEQLSVQALADWLADGDRQAPVLLDVREPWEYEHGHVRGSLHMPMHTVPLRLNELQPDTPVVCICHHGGRSMQVAAFLQGRGFSQVFNLVGGMDQWSQAIDPSIRRY